MSKLTRLYLLVFGIIGFHLFFSGSFSYAQNLEKNLSLITVSGQGQVEAQPDTAYFHFGFVLQQKKAEDAEDLGSLVRKNILLALDHLEISKQNLLLDSASVHESYDYKTKETWHRYHYQLKIRLYQFSKINPIKRALLNEDIFSPVRAQWFSRENLTVHHHLQYTLERNLNIYQTQAVKKAFQNAISKIETLAKSSQRKYLIHRITEQGPTLTPSYSYENRALLKSSSPTEEPDPIPSLQTITSTITVEAKIFR